MRIFFGMLDQAIVNARILLKCKLLHAGLDSKVTAIICLQKMALHLAKPLLQERLTNFQVRVELRLAIGNILSEDVRSRPLTQDQLNIIKDVYYVREKKDKKTKLSIMCERPMCDEHRSDLCKECAFIE